MSNEMNQREQKVKSLTLSLQLILEDFDTFNSSFRESILKERFLSDSELSELLKVDRRTLKRYRQSGKIPYYKLKGKIIYKESEIYKLIEDNYYPAYSQ